MAWVRACFLGALVALAACSSTSNGGGNTASNTVESVCDTDPRAMPYSVGLSEKAMDSAYAVAFVDANPAPPVKGLNTWTVKVTDASGSPVNGATIAVKPWMPDHGHGSSVTPQVMEMPMDTTGTYQISLLDMFMPGIWQFTFTITPTSGPADAVVFTFCVDG